MKLIYAFGLLFLAVNLLAQSPEKMSYQAIVRTTDGEIASERQISIQISIIQGSADGTIIYQEIHQTNTNTFGLVTLELGSGESGSFTFSEINWSDGTFFVETAVDLNAGENFTIIGTSQFLSVPYALYAQEAGNVFSGDYNDLTNTPNIPDFDGDFSSLSNIPAGLDDGDDNTQLTESEVDNFVSNNGYLTEEVDGSITNEIELPEQDGQSGKYLTTDGSTPSWSTPNFTQLTEEEVDDFVSDNGYLTSVSFEDLSDVPTGLSDGDDNTQLTESEVDEFVSNNGYLTEEVDGSVTNEIELPDQDGQSGKYLTTDGTNPSWSSPTFTQLTEAQVDDFVSNNGYLTEEVDGSVTNEIELPDQDGQSGKILKTDGSSPSWDNVSYNDLTDLPVNLDTDSSDDFDGVFSSLTDIPTGLSDGDDDTQLTESQVDDYVSNNGYLTEEVDGSITNEIELPDQDGQSGKILTTDGSSPSWVGLSYNNLADLPANLDTDSSDDFDGVFTSLTGVPSGLSDGDDDTQLTEAQVDNFVSNNGYLTAEVDGSVTNEIELPTQTGQSGKYLTTDGSSPAWDGISYNDLTDVPANLDTDSSDDFDGAFSSLTGIPSGLSDGDDDTQLTESQVDDYVSDNGFLTAEVDGSVTNEIELPPQTGHSGKYLTTDGSSVSWSNVSGSTRSVVTISSNTTLTSTDEIVIINGAFVATFPASPVDGQVLLIASNSTSASINGNGKSLLVEGITFTSLSFADASTSLYQFVYSSTLNVWMGNY